MGWCEIELLCESIPGCCEIELLCARVPGGGGTGGGPFASVWVFDMAGEVGAIGDSGTVGSGRLDAVEVMVLLRATPYESSPE